jgi:hypothetical protein
VVRELHVVGLSPDGRTVLLAPAADARKATHAVVVDERLEAAVRGLLPPPGDAPPAAALTPREIQARLRAGENPDDLARVTGMPVGRILRYAGPVLSERARVLEQAHLLPVARARAGVSGQPLASAVTGNLAGAAGLDPDSVRWDAWRRDDGRWVVTLGYRSRGRERTASWSWQPPERTVRPEDTHASSLGFVASPRVQGAPRVTRSRAARPAGAPPTAKRARAGSAGAGTGGTPARGKAAGRARSAAGTAGRRTPATTARRAAAGTSRTKAAEPDRQAAGAKPRRTARAPARQATQRNGSAGGDATIRRTRSPAAAVPAPPPGAPATQRGRTAGRRGRPALPSWSDVLLGTAGPPDTASRDDGRPARGSGAG